MVCFGNNNINNNIFINSIWLNHKRSDEKKIYILFAMPFFYSCSDSSSLEPIPELYLIEIAAEQNNISAYD